MSQIRTKTIVITFLLTIPLISNSEILPHVLKKGSTISNLLYDELKLRPIYKRPSVLDEVFKINNLNEETAKIIPAGTVILIPMPSKKSSPTLGSEAAKHTSIPDMPFPSKITQTKINFESEVRLGAELFSFSGFSKEDESDFEVASTMATIFYQIKSKQTYFFGAQFEGGLTRFVGSKTYITDRESAHLLGGRHLGNGSIYFMAGLKRDFYFYSPDGNQEELVKGFAPSVGLGFEHKFTSFQIGMQAVNYLSFSIDKNQKTDNNISLAVHAGYWPSHWTNTGLVLKAQQEEKNLKSFEQEVKSLSLSLATVF